MYKHFLLPSLDIFINYFKISICREAVKLKLQHKLSHSSVGK